MRPAVDLVHDLCAFSGRAAGTDAERRAAVWLRDELRDRLPQDRFRVDLQTVWVRPFWARSLILDAAVGVAGSVVCVPAPAVGLALIVVALASLLGDLSGRYAVLRLLTPRRATPNLVVSPRRAAPNPVVSPRRATPNLVVSPRPDEQPPVPGRVRLLVTANLDAGRCGSVYRDGWVRLEARVRRVLRGHLVNPLGLLALALLMLAGVAGARLAGVGGAAIGVVQLFPTVVLLTGFALLVDIALSDVSPGACANAAGVAVALGVLDALAALPPAALDLHVVLAGSGECGALGLDAFMAERARRGGWRRQDVAVVALDACGVGRPVYYTHTGPLLARRLHPQLLACARGAAQADPELDARPLRDHGAGGAFAARRRRWPTIGIGSRDRHDRPGPVRQAADVPAVVGDESLDATLALCLGVIARLDGSFHTGAARPRRITAYRQFPRRGAAVSEAAMPGVSQSDYPVRFEVDDAPKRSRLSTFFRLLLAIPLVIALYVLEIGVLFSVLIAWFALLFTGRWPQGLYNFTAGVLRYVARLYGFMYFATDAYPPFALADVEDYPVRLRVAPPLPQYSRLKVLLRVFYIIPPYIVAYVLLIVLGVLSIVDWLVIVVTGRQPDGLQQMIRFCLSYVVRTQALALLLTETYPPFSD